MTGLNIEIFWSLKYENISFRYPPWCMVIRRIDVDPSFAADFYKGHCSIFGIQRPWSGLVRESLIISTVGSVIRTPFTSLTHFLILDRLDSNRLRLKPGNSHFHTIKTWSQEKNLDEIFPTICSNQSSIQRFHFVL